MKSIKPLLDTCYDLSIDVITIDRLNISEYEKYEEEYINSLSLSYVDNITFHMDHSSAPRICDRLVKTSTFDEGSYKTSHEPVYKCWYMTVTYFQ
jgi:hypothetical protein